jgi:hypothetical protein
VSVPSSPGCNLHRSADWRNLYIRWIVRTGSVKMNARDLIAIAVATTIAAPAFAQTQPTRPSAYATLPTMRSAWPTAPLSPCPRSGLNPTSSCYSGSIYPSYSAVAPFEFPKEPNPKAERPGSETVDADQAKSLIEGKGYLDVSHLEKDRRGIWRGKATMEDGRSVDVTLDLEGNIYSTLSRLQIRIEPPRSDN